MCIPFVNMSSYKHGSYLRSFCSTTKTLICVFLLFIFIGRNEGFNPLQYIGCFEELQNFSLPNTNEGRVMNVKTNPDYYYTVDSCIAACGVLRYTYSGSQDGYQCFCGDKYYNVTSTLCTKLCNGNPSQICGNAWVNSIYSVCLPGTYNWTSSGCQKQCGNCSRTICQVNTGACLSTCVSGWTGDKCDQDIDECLTPSLNGCNQTCTNNAGSHVCSCRTGYSLGDDQRSCADIDECSNNTLNVCNQTCTNTPEGSYSCSCRDGYTFGDDKATCTPAIIGPRLVGVSVVAIVIPVVVCIVVIITAVVIFLVIRKLRKKNIQKVQTGTVNVKHTLNGTLDVPPKDILENKNEAVKNMEGDYYNVGPISHVIKTADLPSRYHTIKANKNILSKEFKSIPEVSLSKDIDFAKSAALKAKNRFKNILPYNITRVKLAEIDKNPLSTYINASFIEGYKTEDKIIAAQGPTKESLNDFWRMIWEYDVSVIFMLAHLVENGKNKCNQYWPNAVVEMFGDISVEIRSIEESDDHVIRVLVASKNGTHRSITHIQFTDWPDHGVPEDALPLLCFRQKTRQFIEQNKYTLYHCSAGVGRTGTYLAIDYLLSAAVETGEVDVHTCVNKLREQRMNCVQTLPQYTFIYQAVSEGVTVGDSLISSSNFSERFAALQATNPITRKTVLQTEFDMLNESNTSQRVQGQKVFINEGNRVVQNTKTKGKRDVINAVFVQGCKKKDGYIAMQLKSNKGESQFWNMCTDYNCKTVLVLTNDISTQGEFLLPQPGETAQHGSNTIRTLSRETCDKLSDCDVCVVSTEIKGVVNIVYENTITIYTPMTIILVGMQSGTTPSGERLLAIHHLVREKCNKNTTQGPIVVLARDDMEMCGLYIAVANISEMMRTQKQVDVIHTVLNVKKSLPHFLTDLIKYEELYQVASVCTQQLGDEPVVYEELSQAQSMSTIQSAEPPVLYAIVK